MAVVVAVAVEEEGEVTGLTRTGCVGGMGRVGLYTKRSIIAMRHRRRPPRVVLITVLAPPSAAAAVVVVVVVVCMCTGRLFAMFTKMALAVSEGETEVSKGGTIQTMGTW